VNDIKLSSAKLLPFSLIEWELFCFEFTTKNQSINKSIFLEIKHNEISFSNLDNGFLRNNLSLGGSNIIFEFGFAGCIDKIYDFILASHQNTYLIEKITPSLIWMISYHDFLIFNKLYSIGFKIVNIDDHEKLNQKIKISLIYLTVK
jgi:hypothetical protein